MFSHWVDSEMYRIPALVAVAGVANLRFLISNTSLVWGSTLILSLEGKVSSLLSSMTEFIDSIQLASRSPSKMIHFGSSSCELAMSLIVLLRIPSFHSLVESSMYP